jgi:hypothetical protein
MTLGEKYIFARSGDPFVKQDQHIQRCDSHEYPSCAYTQIFSSLFITDVFFRTFSSSVVSTFPPESRTMRRTGRRSSRQSKMLLRSFGRSSRRRYAVLVISIDCHLIRAVDRGEPQDRQEECEGCLRAGAAAAKHLPAHPHFRRRHQLYCECPPLCAGCPHGKVELLSSLNPSDCSNPQRKVYLTNSGPKFWDGLDEKLASIRTKADGDSHKISR